MRHDALLRHFHHALCIILPCLLLGACGGAQPALREPAGQVGSPASRAHDIVYTSGGDRDCDKEHIECFRKCWNRQPPYPIEWGDKGHDKHCTRICREAYMECLKDVEARPLAFPNMKAARDWIESHKQELLVGGTIVLVAGVAFVIISGGSGALLLVPLVAL